MMSDTHLAPGQLPEVAAPLRSSLPWWQLTILLALISLLYFNILKRLVDHWATDPNFSHGFLVPVFSAFILWQNRKNIAAVRIQPAWSGLVVISAALGILILGVLGAELFLSRSSLVLLLAGLVIQFWGWRRFRALLFAWAFLFLMIPLPAIVFNQIAFPLQFLASQLASTLLNLMGVPVLREGNIIKLPAMMLEVAEACSGIRSLISLGALAIIYGYFLETRALPRILMAAAAIPIAVVANALRVMGTGLLGQWWNPERALGFFHTFSGWVIFVLSLGMLLALHSAMRWALGWLARRRAQVA